MSKERGFRVYAWLTDTLNQQYRIVKTLKETQDTTILLLRHKTLGKEIVLRRFVGDSTVYKMLLSVRHPNLPNVFEVIQNDDHVTVLEEYIDGVTVADVLDGGRYTESGVCTVCSALCDALSVLHSLGIVHRDIKPENVMISSTGEVKLIDFGAARMYKAHRSADTRIIGTIGYAAPEQFGITQTDERSDLFALGVLMNVMLTGVHPTVNMYYGKLYPVIEKCIKIDPNHRYRSASELKIALRKNTNIQNM